MIPRRLHLIWIGEPIPARIAENVDAWRALLPSTWSVRVWGNEAFDAFGSDPWLPIMHRDSACDLAMIANRLRFLVLERCGGFYVDIDARPLRSLEPLRIDAPCAIAGLHERNCRRDRVCDPSSVAAVAHLQAFAVLLHEWFPAQPRWPRAGPMGEFLRVSTPGLVVWPWQYFCGHRLEPGAFALHWPNRLHSWKNA